MLLTYFLFKGVATIVFNKRYCNHYTVVTEIIHHTLLLILFVTGVIARESGYTSFCNVNLKCAVLKGSILDLGY